MTLAPVLRAVHVRRTPQDAFDLFTGRIGAWWPLESHGLFHGRSGGVAFTDGRLVERSLDGEEAVWGTVTAWEPGRRLAVTWHPGADPARATAVEVHFVAVDGGTRVEIAHSGWEALGDRTVPARRSYAGPNAWAWVLEHFADTVERRVDGDDGLPDVGPLRAAYAAFFAEALAGGSGAPADGGWTAAQVVAHVALNDDGLARVCRALVVDGSPSFDNAVPNDRRALDALVAAHGGDLAALVATGRRRAHEVCLLLDRLDEAALAREVPCRLVDGDEVMVDGPVPWGRIAVQVQAARHLPAHTDQLRALR